MATHQARDHYYVRSVKQNLPMLSLDPNFAGILVDGASWIKKISNNPTHGLTSDGHDVSEQRRQTAVQYVATWNSCLNKLLTTAQLYHLKKSTSASLYG